MYAIKVRCCRLCHIKQEAVTLSFCCHKKYQNCTDQASSRTPFLEPKRSATCPEPATVLVLYLSGGMEMEELDKFCWLVVAEVFLKVERSQQNIFLF